MSRSAKTNCQIFRCAAKSRCRYRRSGAWRSPHPSANADGCGHSASRPCGAWPQGYRSCFWCRSSEANIRRAAGSNRPPRYRSPGRGSTPRRSNGCGRYTHRLLHSGNDPWPSEYKYRFLSEAAAWNRQKARWVPNPGAGNYSAPCAVPAGRACRADSPHSYSQTAPCGRTAAQNWEWGWGLRLRSEGPGARSHTSP